LKNFFNLHDINPHDSQIQKGNSMAEMTFREAIALYRTVYRRFEQIEGRFWGVEGAMIELMKQVGELAKYVMMAERYYHSGREQEPEYAVTKETIGDELADIFAQVIRVADYYEIDLVDAHTTARRNEDIDLTQRGV
jgi:NTP pyrophosphatase (non-canonical NTP hydrolase)